MRGLCALPVTLFAVLAIAGCGGGSKHSSSSQPSQSKSSSTTTSATSTGPKIAPVGVAAVNATQKTHSKRTLKAKSGDIVEFRVIPPVQAKGAKPAKITITMDSGPASSLNFKASAKGHSSSVKVTGSSSGQVSLLEPRYACYLPPTSTFCPFKKVSSHGTQIHLETSPHNHVPITIAALVGPVSGVVNPPPQKPSTTVVPSYTVTQMARTVIRPSKSKGAHKPPSLPFGPTTTAKPGNLVVLSTHLAGTLGAPQPLTVVVNQGPGREIKASSSVPGAKPAVATIKSGTGKPIALVLPTYTCFLPPLQSFCPAVKTTASNHKYTMKFMATPRTPVALIAEVQAG